MIDIEDEVFETIYACVKSEYPDAEIVPEMVRQPVKGITVSVEEVSNYPLMRSQDTSSMERHVNVIYEINVYVNKVSKRKFIAKDVFALIDKQFDKWNFSRTIRRPVEMDDASVYRLVGRYSAIVGEDHLVYRR